MFDVCIWLTVSSSLLRSVAFIVSSRKSLHVLAVGNRYGSVNAELCMHRTPPFWRRQILSLIAERRRTSDKHVQCQYRMVVVRGTVRRFFGYWKRQRGIFSPRVMLRAQAKEWDSHVFGHIAHRCPPESLLIVKWESSLFFHARLLGLQHYSSPVATLCIRIL